MAEGSTGGEGAHDNLSSGDLTKSSTPTIALVAVGGGGKSPGGEYVVYVLAHH